MSREQKSALQTEAAKHLRSPLRAAWEEHDRDGFFEALVALCRQTATGCWEWQRKVNADGYATLTMGRKTMQVHRMSAEMRHGDLKRQAVVHHACARRSCVNPDHLQPISHRENIAEMLQRNYYLNRIADLEGALRVADPTHPLLGASTSRAG